MSHVYITRRQTAGGGRRYAVQYRWAVGNRRYRDGGSVGIDVRCPAGREHAPNEEAQARGGCRRVGVTAGTMTPLQEAALAR